MPFANFDTSYQSLPERFYTRQMAAHAPAPKLIVFNETLASTLGIDAHDPEVLARVFSGNEVPEGATPMAQVYAGHQFGNFSPQLGDGRALLIGEIVTPTGARLDLQLKGSGRTPYSRSGDGKAWLGPVLREYLLSEFMHAAGVPTTRALAAVTTGETVLRERPLPGAILTRVASSHIRVGSFEYFAARRDFDGLRALYTYTRDRHYPGSKTPFEMLSEVITRQVSLVAKWMGLGFIHGVMNTDNTTLSGETIDYGPAAFMEAYHPDTLYSSIDQFGRYAFSNQSKIIVWNIAQLASALLALEDNPEAELPKWQALIEAMPAQMEAARVKTFGRKIGLSAATSEDAALIDGLLAAMANGQADFTNTFHALTKNAKPRDQFLEPRLFDEWQITWQKRLSQEADPIACMEAANPYLVPRNHRVEEAIQAGKVGDYGPFHRLLKAICAPYSEAQEFADLTTPATDENAVRQTFCGT